jgi:hypothetical protein
VTRPTQLACTAAGAVLAAALLLAPGARAAPAEAAAAQPLQVRIAVRNGRVAGGLRRVEVRSGRRILLIVSSNLSDEVHVHGYELSRDVRPRAPARILFRTSIRGRFEIELEKRGLPIAELTVR